MLHLSLCHSLPIPTAISSTLLDKTSTVRLTMSTIRLKSTFAQRLLHGDTCEHTVVSGQLLLEALDGFCAVLSADGIVLYVSESVSVGLGLSQVEMIGNRLDDYVHAGDVERLTSLCAFLLDNAVGHITHVMNIRRRAHRTNCACVFVQVSTGGRRASGCAMGTKSCT